jgi:hypothetical protein
MLLERLLGLYTIRKMKEAQKFRGSTASYFRSSLIHFNVHNLCIDFEYADPSESEGI